MYGLHALGAHTNGRAILIMPSDRVHPIDVPVATMMKCISKWGEGTSELLASMKSR